MRFRFGAVGALGISLSALLIACASAPSNTTKGNKNDPGGGGSPLGGSSGSTSSGFGGASSSGDEPTTPPVDLQACATASAKAEASKVYLVFMFDRSGSMIGSRWDSCKAATQAFFASNESTGISASLHYFPIMGLLLPNCDAAKYAEPAVPMVSLPNGAFKTSLDKEKPAGSTPTGPAIAGALQYANKLRQGQAKDGKVAIVLVSDGDPEGCNGDAKSVAKMVSDASGSIPTYVIGVGDVASLDSIAQAGGTKKAFVVSTTEPTKIEGDLQKAIGDIKSAALSCDYTIPPAPNGEKLDREKVNVTHAENGATASTVPYNQSCEGGLGWRYDNVDAPTRILMCEQSCENMKATPGQVDVVFGCETQKGGVK